MILISQFKVKTNESDTQSTIFPFIELILHSQFLQKKIVEELNQDKLIDSEVLKYYNLVDSQNKIAEYGKSILKFIRILDIIKKKGRNKFFEEKKVNFSRIDLEILELSLHTNTILRTIKSMIEGEILTGGIDLLTQNDVINLRTLIRKHYDFSKSKILVTPCSKIKPFSSSRTQKRIEKIQNGALIGFNRVILSEPIGLLPIECELLYPATSYDMILPSWLNPTEEKAKKKKVFSRTSSDQKSYSQNIVDQMVKILGEDVIHLKLGQLNTVAYLRSTHRVMWEKLVEQKKWEANIFPSNSIITKTIKKRGRISWAFQGLKLIEPQEELKEFLMST